MSTTIIIYHSKTGFSQRYAQWLAEALDCQAVPYRDRKSVNMSRYDTIILLGGLYAGNMSGLGWLKKQPLTGKRAAAVAVGCSPMEWPGQAESMEKLFGGTPVQGFYCQGGLD
ncbi:MAG: flavodoxin domain-containing protein [Oscillospiraceae bacterium]|nr:flavodoxin domain-containing protein [Oscillospiraceae bacterium]